MSAPRPNFTLRIAGNPPAFHLSTMFLLAALRQSSRVGVRAPRLSASHVPQRLSPFVRTLVSTLHETRRSPRAFLRPSAAKKFTSDHEAVIFDDSSNIGTVYITEYAQSSLGDVVFVELPSEGTKVDQGGTKTSLTYR